MSSRPVIFLGVIASLFSIPLISRAADTTQPAAPEPGFSLTIYSTADPATFDPRSFLPEGMPEQIYYQQNPLPGYGVIRENRPITLEQGENTLRFTDVASGIDPTTVSFQSLTAPATASVEEQNYEFDLVSADKLLEKYIDKEVRIRRKADSSTGPSEVVSGTLLSCDASNIVLRDADGGVRVLSRGPDIASIELAKTDDGLITKPTLLWKIFCTQAGKHLAQVTYQTDRLTWRADYNLTLNAAETATDIGAWVTILNQSGAAYPDAKLKLVAGDVQRISLPQQYGMGGSTIGGMAMAQKVAGFAEKSFFEYHLYTLGSPTSLANNSTKQIELFAPKLNIPVTKTYVYYGVPTELRGYIGSNPQQDQNLGTVANKKVDVYLQLTNSEKNGLGIPLPAGRIRVYKSDPADGAKEFIGEDVIQHTPKDENVWVKLGDAFDIVGDRRQTDFHVDYGGHVMTESFEIKVRNHKTEPVHVIVKENLYRMVNWEITACSEKWEKQDSRTIHIPVDVAPNVEKTVTYTVKYMW